MPSRTRESERARSKRNFYKAYAKDPLKFKRRSDLAKAKRLEFIRAIKDQPCADCGITYPPYVMDFDHVRGEKVDEISRAGMLMATISTLLAEIEKCDVVCSNCHRERTFQRKQYS